MKSVFKLAILLAATAMLLFAAVPAGAQLAPISYGFLSVFQSGSTTAFSRDLVSAQDLESLAINFAPGACGMAFPSISQTVDKSYYAEHTDYSHTEEVAAFNYPFVNVGTCGLGYGGLPFGIC